MSSTLIFLILKSIPIWKFSNKVGTNGGHVADGEAVLCETEEEAGLADAGVADHEQLALHVVGGRVGHDYFTVDDYESK